MSNLDRLDRRLLFELDKNSRLSFTALGRLLRIPQETVRYRLHGLLEQGIIEHLITFFDTGRLGYTYYKVLLKLFNVNEAQVLALIHSLKRHPAVNWIARTDGIFDICFTIRTSRIHDLSQFLDELKENYRSIILRITFGVNIEVEFAVRDYLVSRTRISQPVHYSTQEQLKREEHVPDEIDLAILRNLANDTRATGAKIAELLKLSTETILTRIRRLEKQNLITRYSIQPNLEKIGMINYYVFIYLSSATQERIQEFRSFCRKDIHIVYFIKALGEWDFELNIEAESLSQYREIMMHLTKEFSDIIRDYLSLPVSGIHKYTLTPA